MGGEREGEELKQDKPQKLNETKLKFGRENWNQTKQTHLKGVKLRLQFPTDEVLLGSRLKRLTQPNLQRNRSVSLLAPELPYPSYFKSKRVKL